MRASIRSVALTLNLSPMTVSRVLRGTGTGYSEETRDIVLKAVRELNYEPAPAALPGGRLETRVLGVIHEDDPTLETHPVAAQMLAGLRAEARRRDYDLLLLLRADSQWGSERRDTAYLGRRADGLIFMSPHNVESALANVTEAGLPFVCCWEDAPGGAATVTTDSRVIVQLAVRHLAVRGHRRIAHLAGDQIYPAARARCRAFREEMAQAGFPCPESAVVFGHWDIRASVDEADARRVLAGNPTAVVCGNDIQALALLRVARSLGLRVPDDLSVVGIDDLPDARLHGLTTVVNPFVEIGRLAVESVLQLMGGVNRREATKIVPVHLVERGSTGRKK